MVVTRSNPRAQVLLLRRCNTGRYDGSWDCPAGRVATGEDVVSAAARELMEEVGLTVSPEGLVVVHREPVDGARGVVRHSFLRAVGWAGNPVNREPGLADQVGWHDVGALPSPMPPFVARGLEAALRR